MNIEYIKTCEDVPNLYKPPTRQSDKSDNNRDTIASKIQNQKKYPYKGKGKGKQEPKPPKVPFNERFDSTLDLLTLQYIKCAIKADLILSDCLEVGDINRHNDLLAVRVNIASTLFINSLGRAGQIN